MKKFHRDPAHPIPDLEVIDVCSVKAEGGADLHVVIATPLAGDRSSLERLMAKIEGYLAHIKSEGFTRECGMPSPENTRVVVHINPDSDSAAFELLERNKAWVAANDATLDVKILDNESALH